ncbi:hypothetical protein K432DRAFT_266386, partial [Lepidopterella palustris CBS 459.81]
QCLYRDGGRCVIARLSRLEVCHIYPVSLLDAPPKLYISWRALKMFWSEEQISKLVHTIFPNGFSSGIEVLANVACLAQHIHHYWENALFGLKPILISVDKKELVIQFFWLKQQTHLPSIVDLLTPPLEHHQGRNGPEGLKLFNTATEKHIQSGEHIVITTDDPENKPLHNFDIMHMQWSLNRLAALCVRAKPLEFDVISDNDD